MDSADKAKNLREFVRSFRDRYETYHHHKERMAYAGFVLYAGTFVAGIISTTWPLAWSDDPWLRFLLTSGSATAAWFMALWFTGWQLLRRRLAAVRVAAADKLLAKWVAEEPTENEFSPWTGNGGPQRQCWHFFWPPKAPMPEGDVKEERFPGVLVSAWRSRLYALTWVLAPVEAQPPRRAP